MSSFHLGGKGGATILCQLWSTIQLRRDMAVQEDEFRICWLHLSEELGPSLLFALTGSPLIGIESRVLSAMGTSTGRATETSSYEGLIRTVGCTTTVFSPTPGSVG